MLFSKMSSQYQFDAAVMRKCKGSSGLSVAGLEDRHMLDDLNEMLMKLQDLLLANDYRQYIKQSSELVDNIESAEYSFFQKNTRLNIQSCRNHRLIQWLEWLQVYLMIKDYCCQSS